MEGVHLLDFEEATLLMGKIWRRSCYISQRIILQLKEDGHLRGKEETRCPCGDSLIQNVDEDKRDTSVRLKIIENWSRRREDTAVLFGREMIFCNCEILKST